MRIPLLAGKRRSASAEYLPTMPPPSKAAHPSLVVTHVQEIVDVVYLCSAKQPTSDKCATDSNGRKTADLAK